jgi:hypothetical protein
MWLPRQLLLPLRTVGLLTLFILTHFLHEVAFWDHGRRHLPHNISLASLSLALNLGYSFSCSEGLHNRPSKCYCPSSRSLHVLKKLYPSCSRLSWLLYTTLVTTLNIAISVCYSSELLNTILFMENVIFYQANSYMFYNIQTTY